MSFFYSNNFKLEAHSSLLAAIKALVSDIPYGRDFASLNKESIAEESPAFQPGCRHMSPTCDARDDATKNKSGQTKKISEQQHDHKTET